MGALQVNSATSSSRSVGVSVLASGKNSTSSALHDPSSFSFMYDKNSNEGNTVAPPLSTPRHHCSDTDMNSSNSSSSSSSSVFIAPCPYANCDCSSFFSVDPEDWQPIEKPMHYQPLRASSISSYSTPNGAFDRRQHHPNSPHGQQNNASFVSPRDYRYQYSNDPQQQQQCYNIVSGIIPGAIAEEPASETGKVLIKLAASFMDELVSRRCPIIDPYCRSLSSSTCSSPLASPTWSSSQNHGQNSSCNYSTYTAAGGNVSGKWGAIGCERAASLNNSKSLSSQSTFNGQNNNSSSATTRLSQTSEPFISDFLCALPYSRATVVLALLYANKTMTESPNCSLCLNANMLFLAAMNLATKQLDDNAFRNATVARAARLSISVVNDIEKQMLVALDYHLEVPTWLPFLTSLFQHVEQRCAYVIEKQCLEELIDATFKLEQKIVFGTNYDRLQATLPQKLRLQPQQQVHSVFAPSSIMGPDTPPVGVIPTGLVTNNVVPRMIGYATPPSVTPPYSLPQPQPQTQPQPYVSGGNDVCGYSLFPPAHYALGATNTGAAAPFRPMPHTATNVNLGMTAYPRHHASYFGYSFDWSEPRGSAPVYV